MTQFTSFVAVEEMTVTEGGVPRRINLVADRALLGAYAESVPRVDKRIVNRRTVEALVNDLALLCLEDPTVQGVRIRVEKPGAVRFSRSVGVEIERFRAA